MNDTLIIITLLIAVVGWFVVVAGWVIGHYFSISRDMKNKSTELKINYLIEAYRRLENVSHREEYDPRDLESAMADIQLFGTKRQADLALEIAEEFAKKKTVSIDPLLEDLRKDLRKLLHLEHLPGPPRYLRIRVRSESS